MPRVQAWKRMGPGGLPGLQNRVLGGNPVQGGFDSHTLPPTPIRVFSLFEQTNRAGTRFKFALRDLLFPQRPGQLDQLLGLGLFRFVQIHSLRTHGADQQMARLVWDHRNKEQREPGLVGQVVPPRRIRTVRTLNDNARAVVLGRTLAPAKNNESAPPSYFVGAILPRSGNRLDSHSLRRFALALGQ